MSASISALWPGQTKASDSKRSEDILVSVFGIILGPREEEGVRSMIRGLEIDLTVGFPCQANKVWWWVL